ncbi:Uncharacterised protein [Bordetella pertussis]|nr:Uncharacterised protein [Bordetella pertussis]
MRAWAIAGSSGMSTPSRSASSASSTPTPPDVVTTASERPRGLWCTVSA